jgi:serine/threonine protein kinase
LLGATTYNQGIDIWAAGCIWAEFLSGQPLVNGKTEDEQIELLVDCIGVPHARNWPALPQMPKIRDALVGLPTRSRRTVLDTFGELSAAGLELQSRLLHYDSLQRWTAYEGLQSSFFVEFPEPIKPEHMPRFPTQ